MEHKLAQKTIEKKDEKRMSEDTPSTEDGPDLTYAAPVPWTPYPFNSGQPRQHTAHIFEIPSLLFGGKPPSFPAIFGIIIIIKRVRHHHHHHQDHHQYHHHVYI